MYYQLVSNIDTNIFIFILFTIIIIIVIGFKLINDYICEDENLLKEAISKERLGVTIDEERYSDLPEDFAKYLKIQSIPDMGLGIIWTGPFEIPKRALVNWYFRAICKQGVAKYDLPKDTM